ncbi:hypothetical protein BH23GEM6_BH23GEM6_24480 [soil metagenome]
MFTLNSFGGLTLASTGTPLPASAAQRRRLALLAILAVASERGVTRDRLVGILWPEQPEGSARHALEQLVYATRRDLGRESILTVDWMLLLNQDLVKSDVDAFQRALANDGWEEAVHLYRGPFLDGVYLDGACEWDSWADGERQRLARLYSSALEALALSCEAAGDAVGAARAWRQLSAHEPVNSRIALRVMHALDAAGDRAGAILHARIHEQMLYDQCGVEVGAEIEDFACRLRTLPSCKVSDDKHHLQDERTEDGGEQWAAAEAKSSSESRVAPQPQIRRRLRRRVLKGAALLTLVGTAVGSWGASANVAPAAAAAANDSPAAIAVLPFSDLTPEGDAEYFSDGLAVELIQALSRVEGLRVVARTSAFAFKGKSADVREIGAALGVSTVLEGSVRRAADHLKITVQLIDTRTGYHLWSATYERPMADIFAVQEEISRAVVGALRPALLKESATPLVSRSTTDAEAFQLYMQGRYFWNLRTEEGLRTAVDRFERAIRLDSGYAAAYAGLSDAYNSLADNGFALSEPALTRAEAAVRRALELDGTMAEAYSSRGHLRLHRWDWRGAELDFKHAIELNPGYAVAHQYYAFLLTFQGRFDEAIPRIRRASELDPLSLAIQHNVGEILYLTGRNAEAIEQFRTVLQMDPTRRDTRYQLGSALCDSGRHQEAITELRRVIDEAGGWHPSAVPLLGSAYLRAGLTSESARIIAQVERAHAAGRLTKPMATAALFDAVGRRDEAFVQLESALATQPSVLGAAGVSPRVDLLRTDPRYNDLLRRIGLAPSRN